MATYAWLDDAWYAAQKVEQMKVLDPNFQPSGDNLADFNAALAAYNAANGTNFDMGDNFNACNESGYLSTVPQSAINVSPNKFFDVTYYLQSKANAMNAADATANATPQTVLKAMYDGGYSAWAHYVEMADGVDPSALFSTAKYLEAKAAALTAQGTATTAAEVKADLQAKGYNAIMDFMENGASLNITEEMVKPDADKVIPESAISMTEAEVWNPEAAPVVPVDPYDLIDETVEIVAGQTEYQGTAGENTEFTAKWLANSQGNTLNANDVIDGGADSLNTLAVEMGANWKGFNGIAGETIADPRTDNVTNVGRIKIDRQQGVNSGSEQDLTFNAQYISDDAVQYDLNAAGSGSTSLTNLGNNVERINIKNLVAKDVGADKGNTSLTKLSFEDAATATGGNDDSLTIGLNNTGAKAPAGVQWGSGIEHVTVDAMVGTTNGIDLMGSDPANPLNTGIKDIAVTGGGNVNVRSLATGVKTYDASAATGNVTFTTYNLTNQTVKGGSGTDTVNLASTGTTQAKNWDSIETVTFSNENPAGPTTLNAAGYSGLQNVWVVEGQEYHITNLEAANLQVYQTTSTANTKTVSIDGNRQDNGLGNITWQTASGNADGAEIAANFSSNATGTATVKVTEKDTLKSDSVFNFSNAKTVVIEDTNPGASSTTLKLDAANATTLDATLAGAWTLQAKSYTASTPDGTALGKLQNLELSLSDGKSGAEVDLSAYDLADIQNVKVEGDGTISVLLGNLGEGAVADNNGNPGIQMNITGVEGVAMGMVNAGLGGNIMATIEAAAKVVIGDVATTTNLSGNAQGDVTLVIEGTDLVGIGSSSKSGNSAVTSPTADDTTISGGTLTLNFSGLSGDVSGGGKSLNLDASESIYYTGAEGADTISVSGVGAGTTSTVINPGAGIDALTLAAWGYDKASVLTKVTVDLQDGEADTLTVDATNFSGTSGITVVRVLADASDGAGFSGSGALDLSDGGQLALANAILEKAGISATLSGAAASTSAALSDASLASNGHQYFILSNTATTVTDADDVTSAFIIDWVVGA